MSALSTAFEAWRTQSNEDGTLADMFSAWKAGVGHAASSTDTLTTAFESWKSAANANGIVSDVFSAWKAGVRHAASSTDTLTTAFESWKSAADANGIVSDVFSAWKAGIAFSTSSEETKSTKETEDTKSTTPFSLKLAIISDPLIVVRFPTLQLYSKHAAGMLEKATSESFYSVTVTPTETSVVMSESYYNPINNPEIKIENGWVTIRVEGPLDFSLVGILSKLASTLADVNVSIFVISTYDTDYILVKSKDLDTAKQALTKAGHVVFNAEEEKKIVLATDNEANQSDNKDVAGFAPFELERYFAKHEFSAPYLLCCSDIQPLLQSELLAMADDECKHLWKNLSLGYTESQGLPLLRNEIAKQYNNITPEQILIIAPEEGIYLSCRALLRKGDTVIVPSPCYQSLSEVARAVGCNIIKWEPKENEENGLQSFEISDVLQLIKINQPRLVVLNFPHNPTGLTITSQDMLQVVDACQNSKNDCWIFGDEMYRGLEQNSSTQLPSVNDIDYDRTIGLAGMSKLYGLPGLRIGWIVCKNIKLMQRILQLRDYTTICCSAPSEILSLIGLRNHQKLTDRSMAIIKIGMNAVNVFMKEHADIFTWHSPNAGSISFPKLLNGINATMFCDELVKRAGVMLLPASVYGDKKDNRVRLGFGRRNVPEGLDVLRNEIRNVVEWCNKKYV